MKYQNEKFVATRFEACKLIDLLHDLDSYCGFTKKLKDRKTRIIALVYNRSNNDGLFVLQMNDYNRIGDFLEVVVSKYGLTKKLQARVANVGILFESAYDKEKEAA